MARVTKDRCSLKMGIEKKLKHREKFEFYCWNAWKPFNIVTESNILGVVGAQDVPLKDVIFSNFASEQPRSLLKNKLLKNWKLQNFNIIVYEFFLVLT